MVRVQGCDNSVGILSNDGQEGSGRGLGGPPSALPVLDGVEAEAESRRKAGLRHF